MQVLRGVLAALLAQAAVAALRRWGVGGMGAEVEAEIAAWLAHTLDLAGLLLAEALRARQDERES